MTLTAAILVRFFVAAFLIAGGVTLFARAGRSARRAAAEKLRLGWISDLSAALIGGVLVWLGYHLLVYTAGWAHFRAPVWAVWALAALVLIGTLLADALDARNAPRE